MEARAADLGGLSRNPSGEWREQLGLPLVRLLHDQYRGRVGVTKQTDRGSQSRS